MTGEPVVRLAPLTLDVAYELIQLRNDPTVQIHLRNQGPVVPHDQRRWFDWLLDNRGVVRMFAIESEDENAEGTTKEDEVIWKRRLLGCGGLTSIDWLNRRAELSLYTVPAGFEKMAGRLILQHAFKNLGLHRVEAETLTAPRAALCRALGFHHEGIRLDAYWRNGTFINAEQWGVHHDDVEEK